LIAKDKMSKGIHERRFYTNYGLIIFLVALMLRVLLIVFFSRFDWPGSWGGYDKDALDYHQIALGITAGRGADLIRMPGYPVFLSVIYSIFGVNFLSVRIIQIILGALTCYFLYVLTYKIYGKRETAFLSGMLLAVYPFHAIMSVPLLSEVIFTFLFVVSPFVYLMAFKRKSIYLLILSALLFSMAFLFRSHVFYYAFLLGVMIFLKIKNRGNGLKWFGIFILAYLLVPASLGYLNYMNYGSFSIMPVGKGRVFLLGTANFDELRSGEVRDLYLKSMALGKGQDFQRLKEFDKKLFSISLDRISRNPRKYVLHRTRAVLKGWLAGNVTRFGINTSYRECLSEKNHSMLFIKIFLSLFQLVIILLALAGFIWKKKKIDDMFLLIPIFYHFIVFIPISIEPRYFLPVMPFVIVFTCIGISKALKRRTHSENSLCDT
jgi:4-amino-4-deoxy-L-arabinose transferase-like glycosyltransferase